MAKTQSRKNKKTWMMKLFGGYTKTTSYRSNSPKKSKATTTRRKRRSYRHK